MHRIIGLAALAAAAVALGGGIGWILGPQAPAAEAPQAQAVEREMTTGTAAPRLAAMASGPLQVAQTQPSPAPAAPMSAQAQPAPAMTPPPPKANAAARAKCENPDALGVHRTVRSEEHTSELQSLRHLVCRL